MPNPRMQPTGRTGRGPPLGHSAPRSALWNVGLCAGRLESPQLMRQSLDSPKVALLIGELAR
jgi:hypothetical protein